MFGALLVKSSSISLNKTNKIANERTWLGVKPPPPLQNQKRTGIKPKEMCVCFLHAHAAVGHILYIIANHSLEESKLKCARAAFANPTGYVVARRLAG